jgi:hypothetical protein
MVPRRSDELRDRSDVGSIPVRMLWDSQKALVVLGGGVWNWNWRIAVTTQVFFEFVNVETETEKCGRVMRRRGTGCCMLFVDCRQLDDAVD